eukprot:COSAG02_NODE_2002_length_10139_cov_4.784761_2_plen_81_part_00
MVDEAIKQVLSKFERLNWHRPLGGIPSPIGRPAHRLKALDALLSMSSLDPVSIEFWVALRAGMRAGSIAWPFPLIRGIAQ